MEDWNFKDNILWQNLFPMCNSNSKNGSPINIESNNIEKCKLSCELEFVNKPSKAHIKFKNNMIRLKYDAGSKIVFNGSVYSLEDNPILDRPSISVHTPSLHTIDGERFDMEICMFYKSDSEGNQESTDNGMIVSRLINKGIGDFGPVDEFFRQIINHIPLESLDYYVDVPVSDKWGVNMLEPERKSFYTYDGALPFPPCYENYKWIVLDDVGHIGETNFKIIKDNVVYASRPVQRLNDRKVSYNYGNTLGIEAELEGRAVVSDKFLKCIKKPNRGPRQERSMNFEEDLEGLNTNTARNAKNVLLLFTIIVLLMAAFYLVKYLFKQGVIQNTVRKMAGDVIVNEEWVNSWKEASEASQKAYSVESKE